MGFLLSIDNDFRQKCELNLQQVAKARSTAGTRQKQKGRENPSWREGSQASYFCLTFHLRADFGFSQKCELNLQQVAKARSTARTRQKQKGRHKTVLFAFGGTGESRTRVRKSFDTTFYVGSHSFEFPTYSAE